MDERWRMDGDKIKGINMNKFLNILLMGLIIIAVVGLIYLVIPKYSVNTVRIDENWVLVTRVNTLTGQVTNNKKYIGAGKYEKYLND